MEPQGSMLTIESLIFLFVFAVEHLFGVEFMIKKKKILTCMKRFWFVLVNWLWDGRRRKWLQLVLSLAECAVSF